MTRRCRLRLQRLSVSGRWKMGNAREITSSSTVAARRESWDQPVRLDLVEGWNHSQVPSRRRGRQSFQGFSLSFIRREHRAGISHATFGASSPAGYGYTVAWMLLVWMWGQNFSEQGLP